MLLARRGTHTHAAAMILVDEAKLRLYDPIDDEKPYRPAPGALLSSSPAAARRMFRSSWAGRPEEAGVQSSAR